MKKLLFLLTLATIVFSCNPSTNTTTGSSTADTIQTDSVPQVAVPGSKLDQLSWFIGRWSQVEGPDLVSYEEWKRINPTFFRGRSWTQYHSDTVHVETIDLVQEGEDVYYIPTVPKNNGPVRFKMTQLQGKLVWFENPQHDFPQRITYEAKGDTMLMAAISGTKNGQSATKEFPLRRTPR